jgi:hypothetical protein
MDNKKKTEEEKKAIIRERDRVRMYNKYHNDAEFRAMRIAYVSSLQKDPVYNKHRNEVRSALYHRKKAEREANEANVEVSV